MASGELKRADVPADPQTPLIYEGKKMFRDLTPSGNVYSLKKTQKHSHTLMGL